MKQFGVAGEVFPTIIVGAAYGQISEQFDVDVAGITDHLRSRGLSDEQIMATTINFKNEEHPWFKSIKGARGWGRYIRGATEAQVFRIPRLLESCTAYIGFDPPNPAEERQIEASLGEATGTVYADKMSATLVHELEHRIAAGDPAQQHANRKYLWAQRRATLASAAPEAAIVGGVASGVAVALGLQAETIAAAKALGTAIGTVACALEHWKQTWYERYLNQPEEQRCRRAEEIVGTGGASFISYVPKSWRDTSPRYELPASQ